MLESVATSTNYCVPVPLNAFIRLIDSEGINGKLPHDKYLSTRLDKMMGVWDVDYNGHFGSHIFFRLDKEYDNPATHEAIHNLIRECCKLKNL
jgi:hypothetical protein